MTDLSALITKKKPFQAGVRGTASSIARHPLLMLYTYGPMHALIDPSECYLQVQYFHQVQQKIVAYDSHPNPPALDLNVPAKTAAHGQLTPFNLPTARH